MSSSSSLSQKSSTEEIRRRFDADVERFASLETGQQTIIDAPLLLELLSRAAAACTPHARTLLDIGCGAGNNTLKLLQSIRPLDCDLLDLSGPMLARARERVAAANPGRVRTFQADIRSAGLPPAHYDIVIAAAVLHHLRDDADWEAVFAKIYALTAPGGSFWISDMVAHESPAVQALATERYGAYLETLGGTALRAKVAGWIEREDSPRPLTYQIDLLRRVGFNPVDVLHKNACFAAFGGIKPCSPS